MSRRKRKVVGWILALLALIGSPSLGRTDPPASKSRVEAALQNIMTLERPGQDGFATVWDGNKYVQCGRLHDREIRCEAAGALMQPSLDHVITPERISRLRWSIERFVSCVCSFCSQWGLEYAYRERKRVAPAWSVIGPGESFLGGSSARTWVLYLKSQRKLTQRMEICFHSLRLKPFSQLEDD